MKLDARRRSNYNVPKIVRIKKIRLKGPDGLVYIDNPMYRFTMPDGQSMGAYGITPIEEIPVFVPRLCSTPISGLSHLV